MIALKPGLKKKLNGDSAVLIAIYRLKEIEALFGCHKFELIFSI